MGSSPISSNRTGIITCAVLLIAFATIAWTSVTTKSPTFDEPYHAMSAWVSLWHGDFRIDCEDPPLWKYWLTLANGRDAISADFTSPLWSAIPQHLQKQWFWCDKTLYGTHGNDAKGFIQRGRAMMLVWGIILGALIAWWAWHIKGAVAGVVAMALFALDPNFLAHSALVKNDVVFSLAMLALVYMLWRAGRNLRWFQPIVIGVLCGILLTVKFSGVLAVMFVPVMLGLRALMPWPWRILGKERTTIRGRIVTAAAVSVFAGLIGFANIWAVYDFRFSPAPDPAVRLNTDELTQMAATNEIMAAQNGVPPTADEPLAAKPSAFVRTLRFAEVHHLLPQAWLAGLLFTYQSALIRPAFLCGQISLTGWWYYFPLAMAVKTPMATIAAALLATVVAIIAITKRGIGSSDSRWTVYCLAIPAAIYLASAMRSNLNIGVRHVLPVYPLVFIAVGCAAAYAWNHWWRSTRIVIGALGLALMCESLSIFPDYLSFFNAGAGGSAGGFHLLGDSNLDWGQDLKLLAKWQRENPGRLLYLSYFGAADPAYYGVRYVPLRGGYLYDVNPTIPTVPGVIAVSVNNLQGLSMARPDVTPEDRMFFEQFYRRLAARPPKEILGGSIYLYDWPGGPM
jgi:hypothetical protein